jgi:hypothetical protein
MINLEKIVFSSKISPQLKKEIEEDISEFKLNASDLEEDINVKISIIQDSAQNKPSIILSCGYIKEFKFPDESSKNTISGRDSKKTQIGMIIAFNYNNKIYEIYSFN